jgi:hypothetical protein
MPTVFKATSDTATAWGGSPEAALYSLKTHIPYGRIAGDVLIETITTDLPPHSIEVLPCCSRKKP